MKKTILTILAATALLFSCKSGSPETQFSKHGISFTCPAGWSVTEEEDLGGGYYMSIEKEGYNESGLVTITWVDTENVNLSAEEYMAMNVAGLQSNGAVNKMSVSDIPGARYGDYDALGKLYTMSVLTMPHTGEMYVIERDDRVICIVRQSADEDSDKNEKGFTIIEESFTIE